MSFVAASPSRCPPYDPAMDDAPADVRFQCPGCDEDVDVSAELVGQLVRCPYCSTAFFAADGHTHGDVVDDTDEPPADDDRPLPDVLNGLRIRQLSTLRRATLRARSWWVIAALLAASTALDLLYKTVRNVAHYAAWTGRATAFTVVGTVAVAAVVVAVRRAGALAREAARTALPDHDRPPDFSTLDNGADRWRNLNDVR